MRGEEQNTLQERRKKGMEASLISIERGGSISFVFFLGEGKNVSTHLKKKKIRKREGGGWIMCFIQKTRRVGHLEGVW